MSSEILLWAVVENGDSTYHASWSAAQKRFRFLTREGKSPQMFTITEDRLRQWAHAAENSAPVAVQAGEKVEAQDESAE